MYVCVFFMLLGAPVGCVVGLFLTLSAPPALFEFVDATNKTLSIEYEIGEVEGILAAEVVAVEGRKEGVFDPADG